VILLKPTSQLKSVFCARWINPTTAYGMVQTLDVPKGEWLLQVMLRCMIRSLLNVPEACSCEPALCLPCSPLQIWWLRRHVQALEMPCKMPSLCAVLQSAAGSVVGRTITAIAKRKGIKTICLVRRREQKQELFDQGYAVVAVCLAPFGLISTEQCLSRMQFEFPVVLSLVRVQQLASAYFTAQQSSC